GAVSHVSSPQGPPTALTGSSSAVSGVKRSESGKRVSSAASRRRKAGTPRPGSLPSTGRSRLNSVTPGAPRAMTTSPSGHRHASDGVAEAEAEESAAVSMPMDDRADAEDG